jgi:hypothetical protein
MMRTRAVMIPAAVAAAAALAVAVCLPAAATATGRPAARTTGGPTWALARTVGAKPVAPPRFFAGITVFSGPIPCGGFGPLQVWNSGTAGLVAQDDQACGATGLATYGDGSSLVIALPSSGSCSTQLYRLRVSAAGTPGPMSPLGKALHGEVASVAASGNGHVIGYASYGCGKGQPGYLGVMNLATGYSRRWSYVNVEGESPGNVALESGLSMSADGGLLAFTAYNTSSSGLITGQAMRVLPTMAASGEVARRSRVVVSGPAPSGGPYLAGVSLGRSGTSLYLCTVASTKTTRTTKITSYATATGHLQTAIATLQATGSSGQNYQNQALGCPLALDTSGSYLLVPYWIHYPASTSDHPVMRLARIDAATKAVTKLSFPMFAVTSGMDQANGIILGW